MSQKQVGARLPKDDYQKLDQYCSERGISKSEAVTRAVRKLDEPDNDSEPDPLWRISLLISLAILFLSTTSILSQSMLIVTALGALSLMVYSTVRQL